MKNLQKYYMTIQPTLYGVLRLEAMQTEPRTETQPETISTEMQRHFETIRAGNTSGRRQGPRPSRKI